MSIQDFRLYYQFLAFKNGSGTTITTPQFNSVCNQAQLLLLTKDYETFAQTGIVSNYLQVFLKIDNVFQVPLATGKIPFPSDYQFMSSVGHYYNGKQYDCELVDNVSFRLFETSSLSPSVLRFVKYEQTGAGLKFTPKNVGAVYLDYFKTPVAPIWAYTTVNNQQVYDAANSVNFEWDEAFTNEVMAIFLGLIGISIKDTELAQFSTMFKAETKLTI